jgi:hypothetical protein
VRGKALVVLTACGHAGVVISPATPDGSLVTSPARHARWFPAQRARFRVIIPRVIDMASLPYIPASWSPPTAPDGGLNMPCPPALDRHSSQIASAPPSCDNLIFMPPIAPSRDTHPLLPQGAGNAVVGS